jgi:tetratricopeptide (TPR) repeat protein
MHETWLKLNKPDSALLILKQAQQYFDQNPDLYNLLGNYYYAAGNFNEAAAQYAKALTADSSYANAYGNLAYTSLEINNFKNAVLYFKKANGNDPLLFPLKDISLILIDKADNLLIEQKPTEALSLLSLAAGWIPADQSAFHIKTAFLHYLNGEYKQAIPLLEKIVLQKELAESYRYRFLQLLGWCRIDEGNYTEWKETGGREDESRRRGQAIPKGRKAATLCSGQTTALGVSGKTTYIQAQRTV